MKSNILILSFEPFTKEGSNGKTLWSLLEDFDNNCNLSHIFIKNITPNIDANCRFLLIDESKIINPFLSSKKLVREVYCSKESDKKQQSFKKETKKKTPFTMFVRNALWYMVSLKFKYVYKWIEQYKPDTLVFLDNDLPFFCYFARKIKKRFGCKIIFYSTENYSLKKTNYMSKKLSSNNPIFSLFKRSLFRAHEKLFKETSFEIFLTDSLKEEYMHNYSLNQPSVIYPSSCIGELPMKRLDKEIVFSYCGSLGVGRWETLLSFIQELAHYKCRIIVASYLSKEQEAQLLKYPFVDYLGFVSFEKVVQIYNNSDILLHFESFNKAVNDDCKHAFSGKLADCISSCKPFLYYGPKNNSISSFLKDNKCGFEINDTNSLKAILNTFHDNPEYLFINYNNAKLTSKRYFDKDKNTDLLKRIIFSD